MGEFLHSLLNSMLLYLFNVFPRMIVPDPAPIWLQNMAAAVLVILPVLGFMSLLKRRVELPEIYVVIFFVVISAWPWKADRFLLPIYPLFLHYVLQGAIWCWGNLSSKLVRKLPGVQVRFSGPVRAGSLVVAVLIVALPNLLVAGSATAQNISYSARRRPG